MKVRRPTALLAGALVFFFTPAAAFTAGVRAAPIENRPLAELPSVSAGWGFFAEFDAWAVDHLPLREVAVRSNTVASEKVFGRAPEYGARPPEVAALGPVPLGPVPAAAVAPAAAAQGKAPRGAAARAPSGAAGAAASPSSASRRPARRSSSTSYPSVVQGRDDWLYAGEDFELACEPELELEEIFAGYRRLASILRASGRRVVITVAPDKSTIVPDYLPDTYVGERCSTQRKAELWDRLRRGDLGPDYLDMRGPLEQRQAQDGAPIYLRRDSHWSSLGKTLFAREVVRRLQPGLHQDGDAVNGGAWATGGDLARRVGDRSKEETTTWKVRRAGVTTSLEEMDESRDRLVRYAGASRSGAPMFTKPTVLMGDSFSIRSIGGFLPYFTDFTFAHRELWPDERIPVLRSAHVVVLQVVERVFLSDSTSSRGSSLIDPPFLDRLQRELAPLATPAG